MVIPLWGYASTLDQMSIVVQKYGGTSVADAERIKAVAARAGATQKSGKDVVVVVSAMGSSTDDLIVLANEVTSSTHPREMDMLLTAGERISIASASCVKCSNRNWRASRNSSVR